VHLVDACVVEQADDREIEGGKKLSSRQGTCHIRCCGVPFFGFWRRETAVFLVGIPIAQGASRGFPFEDVNEVSYLTKEGKLMSATNWNDRIPSVRSKPVPPVNRLAERVGYNFDRDPKTSRDEFLLEAVPQDSTRRPLSAEDLRLHAWLTERLAVLHYQRHGLWPRLRRFFFGTD
jgi:hypothetical protein